MRKTVRMMELAICSVLVFGIGAIVADGARVMVGVAF